MTNRMNNRTALRLAAVSSAMIVLGAASPAFAQQTTNGNLAVSATVTGNCTLTTTPVAFGNIDATAGAATDAAGAIAVTCTTDTPWAASADVGTGTAATLAIRQMTNGADTLNYGLYTDNLRSQVWGDGTGGSVTVAGTGTGAVQNTPIYARVPGGQTGAPAGVYNDTVVVTVTY